MTDVNLWQLAKAHAGRLCTLFPIFKIEKEEQLLKTEEEEEFLIEVQFSALKLIVVRLLQPLKARFAIVVTEVPIVTEVKLLQLAKA
jgi:hypothetical protein